ncbi:PGAP1-like protein-domain-containing protein [Halteromyces radiatus]|uniref:PGAP1-like protein-domain-containing protein n=1 Tax=Halteromyces radiatus TaxID=101107 RepID=UPI00221FE70D|nr:PGAP1-like protein-domain-containing protein [Halteromyces radiatus]KAI8089282.1 PGAP1-like protein-domain-containing protein [Halteromyces radiatus]
MNPSTMELLVNNNTWPSSPGSPSSIYEARKLPNKYTFTLTTRIYLLLSFLFSLVTIVFMVDSFLHEQHDAKGCQVPYMRPRYVKQTDFDSEKTRFAGKYGLYLYRELDVDISDEVTGTPVLFIPGHAGSYKQVRTIAAEAAYQYYQRKGSLSHNGAANLDVFTVDFHEEFSALHGQSLLEQAEYINDAIDFILKLYPQTRRHDNDRKLNNQPDPSSIILIGHSMGGIVARTTFTLPNYQPGSIHNVITLSTPHLLPPAPFDWQISAIYDRIDAYWRHGYDSSQQYKFSLQDVMLISIAGGTLDNTICSDSTNVGDLIPSTHGFTVFSTAIPHVWSAADHNEILACHQLEKILAKSVLDIIDTRRGSQTKPLVDRMSIMQRAFLSGLEDRRGDGSDLHLGNWTFMSLDKCTLLDRNDYLNIDSTTLPRMALVPIHSTFDALTLLTDQMERYGLLLCRHEQNRMIGCRSVDILVPVPSSNDRDTYPFSGNEFGFASISMNETIGYDYLGIMDHYYQQQQHSATQKQNFLLVGTMSIGQNTQVIKKSMLGIAWNGIQVTLQPSLFSTVHIPTIENPMLAYHLKITSSPCSSGGIRRFSPFLRQSITTMYESKFYVDLASGKKSDNQNDQEEMTTHISIHGRAAFSSISINTPDKSTTGHEGLLMQFWMDPLCDEPLRFDLTIDWYATMGRVGFRNGMMLLTFSFIVVMLVFVGQLQCYNRTGIFPSFTEGLIYCYHYTFPWILALVSLASIYQCNRHQTYFSWISWPDILTGNMDGFFWWIPALGLIVSIGMISGISMVMDASLRWCSSATIFFPSWTTSSSSSWISGESQRIQRRVIVTLILFVLVATVIPYQFVFVLGFLVHIVTCIRTLRLSRSKSPLRRLDQMRTNRYHYMQTILLLLLTLLPFNLPILVVWIRNLSVYWLTPFSSDHNVFAIAPFLIHVEMLTTSMKIIPRHQPTSGDKQDNNNAGNSGRWMAWTTYGLMYGIIVYAFLYGVKYPHSIYFLSNNMVLWLLFLQFWSSRYSYSTFTTLLHFFTTNKRRRPS